MSRLQDVSTWWPIALLGVSVITTGCGALSSPNSPDVLYDTNAAEARKLQVPPDLTDISNTEQFVLPGTAGAAVTRNTLLPQFESVRFVRDGAQSWLAFDAAPEELWPQILAFVRTEKYRVEKTEPVAGTIATQWRPISAVARGNLLNNLTNSKAFSRIAFRLEREGNGARLFARSQSASAEIAEADQPADAQWPESSDDPETTSALLSKLMVFLGIEEQKARGILNESQAAGLLDDAVMQRSASGNQLLIHRGFQPSFKSVLAALQALDVEVISRDDGVGRIEIVADTISMVIELMPVHISAVRVELSDPDGRKLNSELELELLSQLQDQLA